MTETAAGTALQRLLPGDVISVEAYDDPLDAYLFPVEAASVADAVEKRRQEFTTGRHLARLALAELGIAPVPLPVGPNREPCWPGGVVGSITHCAGYRAAAVASCASVAALGIDAEPNEPIPPGVLEMVALPEERDHLASLLADHPDVCWDRLLFSAKESVYKVWFPLARRWLGFEEAAITFDPVTRTFDARLLVPAPALPDGKNLTELSGRWQVHRNLVLAAIAIPAPSLPPAPPRQVRAPSVG